jgi:hypothetical protein
MKNMKFWDELSGLPSFLFFIPFMSSCWNPQSGPVSRPPRLAWNAFSRDLTSGHGRLAPAGGRVTVACGEAARQEARACEASFRRWHPDIPFLCIGEEEYPVLIGGNPPGWTGEIVSFRSLAGWFLSRHVKRLVYLDTDLWVLGRLEKLVDDTSVPTAWTRDWAVYTMGVPDCPRINSGVLASSDPNFWAFWTGPQYGCLVPALPKFYFNQLSLRLVVKAHAARGQIIDGQAGAPFYNVSIGEHPGEWRVDHHVAFKGAERALIFHQAGEEKRGIAAAPEGLRAFLAELSATEICGPTLDLAALWAKDGPAFTELMQVAFAHWPTLTLDHILKEQYARTPGLFRSVAPAGWDRYRQLERTGFRRVWNQPWQAYVYSRDDEPDAD